MIHSKSVTTIRPVGCHRFAQRVLSGVTSASWKYARNSDCVQGAAHRQQFHSFHTTGTTTIGSRSSSSCCVTTSSRRQFSGFGAHSDYHAGNRNTTIKGGTSQWTLTPFGGHLQHLSSHRMSSTTSSSNLSDSKKGEGTIEDDKTGSSSSFVNNGNTNTADKIKNGSSDALEVATTAAADEVTPKKTSSKGMMKQYGPVFFGTYFAIYCSTVFGLFMSVQSGHLDVMYIISLITGSSSPTDPGGVADPDTIEEAKSTVLSLVEFLESYTLTRPVAPMVEEYPSIGNLAIAWIATKFTEPIRFGATVALTPTIARYFGYKKRVPPAIENAGPTDVVSSTTANQKDAPPVVSSDSEKKIGGSSPPQ